MRWLLLIERGDGHGWALPGGGLDDGETGIAGAVRELHEETGLVLPPGISLTALEPRYVPDPRATDRAWMVTTPVLMDLGEVDVLPEVKGADDAARAAWCVAPDYDTLLTYLVRTYGGEVFGAHAALLHDLLG